MLARLNKILKTLLVYPKRMMTNLNLTGGLVYSQRLLLALVDKGAVRTDAYEAVQRHAMAAWKGRGDFQSLVEKDGFISKHLSRKEIASCFDPTLYLKYQDQVFTRVFGRAPARKGSAPSSAKSKPRR